jgi:prepilin-type N-terminal cleavage/methylation domain-containing protein
MQPTRGNAAGFSLAELIVVTIILAVLATGAVPIFRTAFAETREEHAVRSFVDTLHRARTLAIARTSEMRVYLYPEEGTFELLEASYGSDRKPTLATVDRDGESRHVLPDRIRFLRPEARQDAERDGYFVAFYPSGASDAATLRIAREDARWKDYTVALSGTRIDLEWLDD